MVKEADALVDAGYTLTMLYMYWNEWAAKFDKELIASKKWTAICVGGDPENNAVTYFLSRLIYKLANSISKKSKGKFMADFAIARASYFLINAAKKQEADIYLAHNIGALPAVVIAAKNNNKPCGFDAEDFHRHETSDDVNDNGVILKTNIENKYIPQLNYFSASSKQIADAYQQVFPGIKPIVLLNVFPDSNVRAPKKNDSSILKLFWFSQTIGPDRGLDDIVSVLQSLDKTKFELHLLGNQSPDNSAFITKITSSDIQVKFYEPVHPDKLIEFAAQFDIGLALENKTPQNRDICLTNKIFTYMQAGLALIASDTTAQKYLMDQNKQAGSLYTKGNIEELKSILLNYYHNRGELMLCKTASLRVAHLQYNWEIESIKFLKAVNTMLNSYK